MMKRLLALGLVIALGSPAAVMAHDDSDDHDGRRHVQFGVSAKLHMKMKDNYIFIFRKGVRAANVPTMARSMTRKVGGKLGYVYKSAVYGFSAHMTPAQAERLMASEPDLAYYEHDQPMFAMQSQPPQQTPWGITRVNGGVDATGKTAWVIDTGIDLDHPDLNVDTSRSTDFAADACFFIYCFDNGNNGGNDLNGHGSHVAGIIAAKDNGIGVVGVAANATLVAVRVLDPNGSGSNADVIAGVDYVAANAAPGDVANMSLGGGFSQALNDAVINAANKGIMFALAAGNESQDANNVSPASTEHPNVYTVSAIDDTDTFASFSNFGNPPVDCAAPGVNIYSTYKDAGYQTLSGTSMATPHVAGLLLITGGHPNNGGLAQNDPDGNPDIICVN
ncbi:MAG: S8 family peptidase [Alphaproteobacteria bacterium]|nr:MAG: S8 family peptidase [Alphaproteobacteria bacterium]